MEEQERPHFVFCIWSARFRLVDQVSAMLEQAQEQAQGQEQEQGQDLEQEQEQG